MRQVSARALLLPAILFAANPLFTGLAYGQAAQPGETIEKRFDPPPRVPLFSGPEARLTPKEQKGIAFGRDWAGNRDMPARGEAGATVFVFGSTLPTIVRAPLFVCDLALEPGEGVNDLNVGDSVRWKITPASEGSGESLITHVIIKPTDVGLITNLVLTTNRRTYTIKLISREKDWMPKVSFDNDSLECSIGSQPRFWAIPDVFFLQFEGCSVPDIVSYILLIDQNLVHRATGPRASQVGRNPALIENVGDITLSLAILDKSAIDPAHNLDLLRRSGHENDAIGLDAFVLASSEFSFDDGILIDKAPAQTEASGSSLAKSKFDKPALPCKNFRR